MDSCTSYLQNDHPGASRHPLIPLLRRGGSREATDGVVCCVPADAQKTTPALRATPPKEGNGANGAQL